MMHASNLLLIDFRTLSKIPVQVFLIVSHPRIIRFLKFPTFSIAVVYTNNFKWPHKKKSKGFKSGDWAGHQWGPPRPIQRSSYVAFKNSRATKLKCAGAPSCINHITILVAIGTFSKNPGSNSSKKCRYTSPVSLSGKNTGPISQSPTIPTQTFNENWCWKRSSKSLTVHILIGKNFLENLCRRFSSYFGLFYMPFHFSDMFNVHPV